MWQGYRETGTLVHSTGNVKWYSHCEKQFGGSSKIRHRTTIWSSNSTSGYVHKITESRDLTCTPMFIETLFIIAKRWNWQVSIDRGVDKQNVVQTYSGIFFSLKKEGTTDTCYNMDGP